jgi:hypothetical protein
MSPEQIGKVWTVLGLFLLYYVLNTWIVTQGGQEIFDAKLVMSYRIPAAMWGIPIACVLIGRVDHGYRFTSPGFRDDVPKYRIRQCQLEKELQASKTVADILDKLSQLSELSQLTACILRQTTGNTLAEDDAQRYGDQFSIWYLTTAKK